MKSECYLFPLQANKCHIYLLLICHRVLFHLIYDESFILKSFLFDGFCRLGVSPARRDQKKRNSSAPGREERSLCGDPGSALLLGQGRTLRSR